MPVGVTSFLEFETDIVQQDVPLIIGLDLHRRHGCSSDEYHNTFTHLPSNTTIRVKFKKGHLYVGWPTAEVMFTRMELKKLHERFGHSTSGNLINLLKRAWLKNCDAEIRGRFPPSFPDVRLSRRLDQSHWCTNNLCQQMKSCSTMR